MTLHLDFAGLSDPGHVRELNEDAFHFEVKQSADQLPVGLFIVCDGIGGHQAGEVASHWAIETVKQELANLFAARDPRATIRLAEPSGTRRLAETEMEDRLRRAVERANEVVHGYARNRPGEAADLGTTITMALVQGTTAYVANVGDSRTYLIRGGRAAPITRDHSLVASLVGAGQITPDEVYTHPQRNLIYRSLGQKSQVEVDVFRQELQPGDVLLLCSDGLWEMVRDPEIVRIVAQTSDPQQACRRLVNAANAAGGEDNITAVVVKVRSEACPERSRRAQPEGLEGGQA
jgi:serine/threonine protein phosphatase PrpC